MDPDGREDDLSNMENDITKLPNLLTPLNVFATGKFIADNSVNKYEMFGLVDLNDKNVFTKRG